MQRPTEFSSIHRPRSKALAQYIALFVAVLLALPGAAIAAQAEEEEVDQATIDGGKLVLTVNGVDLSPDGTFVHESGDYSVAFRGGDPVAWEGFEGEAKPIEKVEVRRGRLVIYLEEGRVRLKGESTVSPTDGTWRNRDTGAELVIQDARIIKCKGLEKS